MIEFACGIPHLLKGEFSENVSTDVDSYSIRQPLGVVAGITPFNFPAMVPMWMYPIAIACGNTFVLKPSEKDPSAAIFCAQLLAEAGLPDGVFNVVHGDKAAVDAILEHPGIAAVSFVGSTPIARYIYETGTRARQARAGARRRQEPHGRAARRRHGPRGGRGGERRLRLGRRALHGDLGARRPSATRPSALLPKIRERIASSRSRPGDEPGAEMGPLVTKEHHARSPPTSTRACRRARSSLEDGRKREVPGHDSGFFLGPCLFDRVTPEMTIYKDEIFGPVLSVVRAASYDEAIALVNANPLRQRRRDLHERRRRGAPVPERGPGRHGRHQRPDPRADGLLLVRRLEELAVRRLAHLRPRGRPLLHARQGGHQPLARPAPPRRGPRLPADEVGRRGKAPENIRSRWPRWLPGLAPSFVILVLVYFVAGKLGLRLAFLQPSATLVWPPTGIALAALLLRGYRLWPAVLLAAFLVNVTTAGSSPPASASRRATRPKPLPEPIW